jgi:hypothetical protein
MSPFLQVLDLVQRRGLIHVTSSGLNAARFAVNLFFQCLWRGEFKRVHFKSFILGNTVLSREMRLCEMRLSQLLLFWHNGVVSQKTEFFRSCSDRTMLYVGWLLNGYNASICLYVIYAWRTESLSCKQGSEVWYLSSVGPYCPCSWIWMFSLPTAFHVIRSIIVSCTVFLISCRLYFEMSANYLYEFQHHSHRPSSLRHYRSEEWIIHY